MATKATTLFSLNKVKAYIPVQGSTHDTLLETIADAVSERIEQETRRKFVTRSITDLLDGNGRSNLRLRTYPVISITSLKTRESLWDALTLVPNTEYLLNSRIGEVVLRGVAGSNSVFPKIDMGVEVVYDAGWGAQDAATLPSDIFQAGLEWVKFVYIRGSSGQLTQTSSSMANMSSVTLSKPPSDVQRVIDTWQKIRF